MIQVRDQNAYDTGSIAKQISCQFIRRVFQMTYRLFNFFAGLSLNITSAFYYSGHSNDHYYGIILHIFNTCHTF